MSRPRAATQYRQQAAAGSVIICTWSDCSNRSWSFATGALTSHVLVSSSAHSFRHASFQAGPKVALLSCTIRSSISRRRASTLRIHTGGGQSCIFPHHLWDTQDGSVHVTGHACKCELFLVSCHRRAVLRSIFVARVGPPSDVCLH